MLTALKEGDADLVMTGMLRIKFTYTPGFVCICYCDVFYYFDTLSVQGRLIIQMKENI